MVSILTAEVFVQECRTTSIDVDLMGMRGVFHEARVAELLQKFPEWRAQRLPGSRAFQSTYDRFAIPLLMDHRCCRLPRFTRRVGTTVCRWLFQTVHDTSAISVFDYVLPLMVSALRLLIPTKTQFMPCLSPSYSALPKVRRSGQSHTYAVDLPRWTIVHDNNELVTRAKTLLVRMCGVTPPRPLIGPILKALFSAIQNSPVRPFSAFHGYLSAADSKRISRGEFGCRPFLLSKVRLNAVS